MSIFKRAEQGNVQQASASPQTAVKAAAPESKATMTAPVAPQAPAPRADATPGVVPPPAAPIYSTQSPAPAPRAAVDTTQVVPKKAAAPQPMKQTALAAASGSRVVQQTNGSSRPVTSVTKRALQPVAVVPQHATPVQQRQHFDAARCAQAGLLHLAWSWQEAGSPIRAIHAYMELLTRWPDTPAAEAAVADLAELSNKLTAEGQFHTALAIYDQLEELM